MTIATTKKTLLLLSIISFHGFTFGMLDLQNKIVLSQKKRLASVLFVPLAAAACYALAQHKDEISSLLEKISMPNAKVIVGLATAAAMPATYVLAGKFSPEEQFQLYHRNNAEIQKHQLFRNKKMLAQFVAPQEKVQLDKPDVSITLLEFINNNFSDEVDNGLHPTTKAVHQLCDLERRINTEKQRLQNIGATGISSSTVEEEKNDSASSIDVPKQLAQLDEDVTFVREIRGKIINLPEYKEDKKMSPAIKKNKLTEEQITFSSKIAAFVPMFTQPVATACMVFLGILFAKFGIIIA